MGVHFRMGWDGESEQHIGLGKRVIVSEVQGWVVDLAENGPAVSICDFHTVGWRLRAVHLTCPCVREN